MTDQAKTTSGDFIRLSWTWRWGVGFVALVLALHEAHELAHTWLGRLLCGGWGERDFNTWSLVEGCDAAAPVMAGPIFTYGVLWAGTALLWAHAPTWRRAGVALLFASNPLSRILTVALGGGDELVAVTRFAGGDATVPLWLGTLAAVLVITLPPLWLGWRALRATPRRWLWFLGLLLGPTALVIVIVLVFLNGLLNNGLGETPVVLGEPILVLAATVTIFLVVASTYRWLGSGADREGQ